MPPADLALALARLEEKTDHQSDVLHRLDHAINGNGVPGLKTKVDRLEQAADGNKWLIRAVAVAVIGLIVRDAFRAVYPERVATATPVVAQPNH